MFQSSCTKLTKKRERSTTRLNIIELGSELKILTASLDYIMEATQLQIINMPYTPRLYGMGALCTNLKNKIIFEPMTIMENISAPSIVKFRDVISILWNEYSELEIMHVAIRLVSAVQNLHSKGYRHGDLNPQNVFVDLDKLYSGKSIYIIDYGSASHT
jgi:serine/threonine protein kinase